MAEKSTFENELPKKSTVKWLRGLDENGNPVLIDISDHATVVGGLIGKYYFIYRRLNFYENLSTFLRVKKLENGWFFLFAGADNGYPALYLCSFLSSSDAMGIKCEKLASGNGNSVTIYKKDDYFYFKKIWGGNSQVYSSESSLGVVETVNSIPDGAEEVGTY